ncbi:urease accessory protein UreF [Chondromyces crocatus]|uniref:Urease accessory protein UreF n=1 Tax=Chondromyces crocatus TaxID=52 RepID=A0A0K1ECS8_CHOCO|nr:urease accessory UreF family protein [Chondromyces crocatus]AKT38644.1 urease accessory protein UreF [Chondromyces crocatus]
MNALLLLLQLSDSAFPTGGFAHSSGLEAAAQLGEIQGHGALFRIVQHSLHQTTRSALPLLLPAYRAPSRLFELDRLCEASTTCAVANRASRVQGRAWLATTASTFGSTALWELRKDLRASGQPGHLAPLFGVIAHHLDLGSEDPARLFLFLHLRGLLSSAVRLGLIGPLEAQGIQARFGPLLESLCARARSFTEDDLATTAPLLDVFQSHHDRLYSRLFSS